MNGSSLLARSWLPPNAAAHGVLLDRLLHWNLAAIGILFALAHILLAVVLLKRHYSSALTPHRVPSTWRVEFIPLTLLCLMYLIMAVTAEHLWAADRFEGAAPASMQVEVTGRQFQWYFRYPGPDAEFGQTRPSLIEPAAGNPLGLAPEDNHGRDDLVASELVLPVDREVDLTLRAQDVIHGFFIPAMRLKQNAVPGLALHVHFTPIATGTYPILCTQVCGLGHARMQARLRVLSQSDFALWLVSRTTAARQVTP